MAKINQAAAQSDEEALDELISRGRSKTKGTKGAKAPGFKPPGQGGVPMGPPKSKRMPNPPTPAPAPAPAPAASVDATPPEELAPVDVSAAVAEPTLVLLTLGSYCYGLNAAANQMALVRRRDMRSVPKPVQGRALAAPWVAEPGLHVLYATSGAGKSNTMRGLATMLEDAGLHVAYPTGDAYASVVTPARPAGLFGLPAQACVLHVDSTVVDHDVLMVRMGEPDMDPDVYSAVAAGALMRALEKPTIVVIDSLTDLSRAAGPDGTMTGGFSSTFSTDMRHLAAALRQAGSVVLATLNPLVDGERAGIFREIVESSATGVWTPSESGSAAPVGHQRGPKRHVNVQLWGGATEQWPTRPHGLASPTLNAWGGFAAATPVHRAPADISQPGPFLF